MSRGLIHWVLPVAAAIGLIGIKITTFSMNLQRDWWLLAVILITAAWLVLGLVYLRCRRTLAATWKRFIVWVIFCLVAIEVLLL